MEHVEQNSLGGTESSFILNDEDHARSATYAILASLLSHTPNQDTLDYLRHINSEAMDDDSETGILGQAWQSLKSAAEKISHSQLDDEYHDLFIGLGRGQVVPFASWHMTGFLMDKPLSDLRDDLKALGIESDGDQKDPEDHIAALCETMSILIQSEDVDESWERRFFIRHLQPWAKRFFSQLRSATSANFYQSVGFLGEHFMELESYYLNIKEH